MKNLAEHYLCVSLTPRIHGNSHRAPHNAFSYESIEKVVKFLFSYAEQARSQRFALGGSDFKTQ